MAKDLQSPAWRRPTSESTLETVRELRAARSCPRWARPLGVVLMLVAGLAALDPDYPMPREVLQSILSRRVTSEGVVAAEPRGNVASVPEVFRWTWAGDDREGQVRSWTLVLLDAQFSELARVPVAGTETRLEGVVRDAIATAAEIHWFVESAAQKGVVRSAPVAVQISR